MWKLEVNNLVKLFCAAGFEAHCSTEFSGDKDKPAFLVHLAYSLPADSELLRPRAGVRRWGKLHSQFRVVDTEELLSSLSAPPFPSSFSKTELIMRYVMLSLSIVINSWRKGNCRFLRSRQKAFLVVSWVSSAKSNYTSHCFHGALDFIQLCNP